MFNHFQGWFNDNYSNAKEGTYLYIPKEEIHSGVAMQKTIQLLLLLLAVNGFMRLILANIDFILFQIPITK